MTEVKSPAGQPGLPGHKRAAARGRIDKREAILDAAFAVFARQGYAQTCVSEIATEAKVAKPTVYSHLADKANLFRQAIAAAAAHDMADNLAVIAQLDHRVDDPRTTLENVGHQLLTHFCEHRPQALRRLLNAEIVQFPELLQIVRGPGANQVAEALADRLARLATAGHLQLDSTCLVEAAEQFLALLTGPAEVRSALGTRSVSDTELRTVTARAVRTFLLAFGTHG